MEKKSKRWRVVVLPGDGTGPEVTEAALSVIKTINKKFGIEMDIIKGDAGFSCIKKFGTNLPKETISLLNDSDCVLKGPMTTPEGGSSEMSVAVKIRKMFELYANVRPCRNLTDNRERKIDLIIVRENTEGMYSGLDFMVSDGVAIGLRVITRRGTERVGRYAIGLSEKRKKHLTVVHKANILKKSDGMFKDIIIGMAKRKKIVVDDAHVDAMAQWLIKNPERYDVLVTENLFGDILSDEAAMVAGGIGIAPSANIGERYAMFEPIHGSAPKYAGMDIVNPIATILSVKMMYEWMKEENAAKEIDRAVMESIKKGIMTKDMGGKSKCSEVSRHISKNIEKGGKR